MSVSDLTVRCGDWDITNHNELHLHQDRGVSKVMIHPLYSGKKSVNYNFALLVFSNQNRYNFAPNSYSILFGRRIRLSLNSRYLRLLWSRQSQQIPLDLTECQER